MPPRHDHLGAIDAHTVRALVDRSFALRFNDRSGMFREASRAVALAERSTVLPPDLRGAAWTQYGNVLRIIGEGKEAEQAFKVAAQHLGQGSDAATRANLFEIWASLSRQEHRLDEALAFLNEAMSIHQSVQDAQAEMRCLILAGRCNKDAKRHGLALEQLQRAADNLTLDSDSQLYFLSCHGIVDTLVDAGRLNLAAASYTLLVPMVSDLKEAVLAAQHAWVRGRLYARLGLRETAEQAYKEAIFLFESLPFAPELPQLRTEFSRDLGVPLSALPGL